MTDSLTGRRLGPYRVERELGAGGMGTVYLGTVEEATTRAGIGEHVALKVVHRHLLARTGMFKRFLREAEVGKRIRHDNVVSTIDVDGADVDGASVLYLAMEYVEGRTLRDLAEELGAVPEALLREIGRQTADGLDAIHAQGVVHRDLKPENVLLTPDHRVRIMDLGVARLVEESLALTEPGQFVGSLLYGAPEQFRGGEIAPACDLYSLGVMLYELATGRNPFRRGDAGQVIAAHLNEVPPPAVQANPDVSPFLSELIATLTSKAPGDRLGSAAEVRDVLRRGETSAWWGARETSGFESVTDLPSIDVRRRTDVFGRSGELEAMRVSWARAVAGDGSTVLLEGEAGIGKTRLVDAFVRELPPDEAHVLYGSYPPSGGLGGISDALLAAFGSARFEEAVRPYLSATPRLIDGFAAVVRHESPMPGTDPLDGQAFHAVMCHLMRGLAAQRPLLWIVDDLHFAEPLSRQIVLSLARAAAGHRVLLLLTSRPGLPDDEMAHFSRLESFRRLPLDRLSPRQVIQLLRDALGSEALADRLGGQIAYKSDGVPFFVFEMIQELKDSEILKETGAGTFELTGGVENIEVPSAVRDLIHGRLRDLSEEERAVLDVACVHGFELDGDLVARVRDMKRLVVLELLAGLERRSGVVRSGGGRCRFDHHQIQEVLYQDLMLELREEYHALLADAIADREGVESADDADDPEVPGDVVFQIANHHLRGNRQREALPFVDRALAHLAGVYRNQAAVELADRALGVRRLLHGGRRGAVLLAKARILGLLGWRTEEREALDEAVAISDGGETLGDRAVARRDLGWQLISVSKPAEAEVVLLEAIDLAGRAGDAEVEAAATGYLGTALLRRGRFDEARQRYEDQLALARDHDLPRERVDATGNLGIVFKSLGRYDDARRCLESAVTALRETDDRRAEAKANANLGNLLTARGSYDEARERYEQALAVLREVGDRQGEASVTANLGSVAKSQGRNADALSFQTMCLDVARDIGDRFLQAVALTNLGPLHAFLGDPAESRAALDEAAAIVEEIGAARIAGYVKFQSARTAEAAGNAADAEALHREALSAREKLGYPRGVMASRLGLGRVLVAGEDWDGAREHLEEAIRLAGELDADEENVLAAGYLSLVPGSDAGAGECALANLGQRLRREAQMEARYVVWLATRDATHLDAAYAILDDLRAGAPEEARERMVRHVPLHRAIAAASDATRD